jgi:phosphoribosylaminoimidazolecarboxamide formyltransferase / IMP cyclohydrolase
MNSEEHFSKERTIGRLLKTLRYGENPHQEGWFYKTDDCFGIPTADQKQGKELSYNNIADADAALGCVAEFKGPAAVIVKHQNPCGVAEADSMLAAYKNAHACDPVSAFGGVIALNGTLHSTLAKCIIQGFVEVIVAPDATCKALDILQAKKNIRVLITGGLPYPRGSRVEFRSIIGGFLVQTRDAMVLDENDLKVVTERKPTGREMADMRFAFTVAKHVKSNTIVYVKNKMTVGIGAGQVSRVDAARIGAIKAREMTRQLGEKTLRTEKSVAASDAFFPFADGLKEIVAAGVTAVIQPGGSMNDEKVIAAANEAGISMVFTGIRHFRH